MLWFATKRRFWPHLIHLSLSRIKDTLNPNETKCAASEWAQRNTVDLIDALTTVGVINSPDTILNLPLDLIDAGNSISLNSGIEMGGAADLTLLYNAVYYTNAKKVVETGVAWGWSSLSILAAHARLKGDPCLVSIDMPYPKLGNERLVGAVVPQHLRRNWTLIREPDRNGLIKGLAMLGAVDLAHYDSDKSYSGRIFGYNTIWNYLRSGGLLISDDIEDNLAFADFVAGKEARFAVVLHEGRYIGIAQKLQPH